QTAVEYTGTDGSPWGELKLISGGANPVLAGRIAEILDVQLTDPRLRHFPDGEINVKIEDSMRGHDVFVIQPTSPPVNEHLMELFIILDALRRASAGRVTAVIAVSGYVRGRDCCVIEDIITTGGTVSKLAAALRQQGANRVLIVATHPVLSGDAMDRLRKADVEELIVTDTIPIPAEKLGS